MEKKADPKIYVSTAPARPGSDRVDIHARRNRPPDFVDELNDEELGAFVKTVIGHGDLASFSFTSDGGALSITITVNGTRFRGFGKSADHTLTVFTDLIQSVYG